MFVNFDRSEQLKSNHHCNQSTSSLFFFNLVSSREAFHLAHHALREFCNFAQQTVKQLEGGNFSSTTAREMILNNQNS